MFLCLLFGVSNLIVAVACSWFGCVAGCWGLPAGFFWIVFVFICLW